MDNVAKGFEHQIIDFICNIHFVRFFVRTSRIHCSRDIAHNKLSPIEGYFRVRFSLVCVVTRSLPPFFITQLLLRTKNKSYYIVLPR